VYNEKPLIGSLLTSGIDITQSGSCDVVHRLENLMGNESASLVQGDGGICAKSQASARSLYDGQYVYGLLAHSFFKILLHICCGEIIHKTKVSMELNFPCVKAPRLECVLGDLEAKTTHNSEKAGSCSNSFNLYSKCPQFKSQSVHLFDYPL
jgi:hypothetical protein